MINLSHRLLQGTCSTFSVLRRTSLSLIGGKRLFMDNGSQWNNSNSSNYQRGNNEPYREFREKREIYRGSEKERASSKTLFVGALPRSWGEEEVRKNFKSFGPIESIFIHSPSKGFSFVKYENRSDAEAALAAQDGKEFDGRRIAIDWSVQRPREDIY